MKGESMSQVNRRTFLAAAGAGTFTLMQPAAVWGAPANSTLNLGLIGCGGRGRWIADLFQQSGLYRFGACADYFEDRVTEAGAKLGVPPEKRFRGLTGYRQLLDEPLDAVVIETPPYFHPEQAEAAVTAGKHVFLAKPIAVDVPGCQRIAAAGRRATEKQQVFLVDFQTRANEHFRESLRRVHQGDIGELVMVEAHYPWRGGGRGLPPGDPTDQLRQWYYVLELSGDFIVEQSIHALDVATWVLNADPIQATGSGGRKVRPAQSIYDHFAVNYQFPRNVVLSFTSIQSIPEVKDEITCRAFGSDGVFYGDYFGDVWIRGKTFYKGNTGNLYTTGAQQNIREFHRFIVQGEHANPTVIPSVRANLTAILGREAAYRNGTMSWSELLTESETLQPRLPQAPA